MWTICASTRFRKRPCKLWTFYYPKNRKAQSDYILINKMWKNSMKNSEVFHKIVTTEFKLSLWANQRKNDIIKKCKLTQDSQLETSIHSGSPKSFWDHKGKGICWNSNKLLSKHNGSQWLFNKKMSSKNTEERRWVLRDWLYCTKKPIDRYGIKQAGTRKLQER